MHLEEEEKIMDIDGHFALLSEETWEAKLIFWEREREWLRKVENNVIILWRHAAGESE